MNLLASSHLKELPDLSNAINVERLNLSFCQSLVEIPSSIKHLQKLEWLDMSFCVDLQVVPTHFNLASLKTVEMIGCWKLRKFSDIFMNVTKLRIPDTMDLIGSISLCSRLQDLTIYGSFNNFPQLAKIYQRRRGADIEKIPDCIKDLHELKLLYIHCCPKLASLSELPRSLRSLLVDNCESLETLESFPSDSEINSLYLSNCSKLGQEARRLITQQSSHAWVPGKEIPAEFDHRAIGNSLTIPSVIRDFRICVVISPKQQMLEYAELLCRPKCSNAPHLACILKIIPMVQTEHIYIHRVRCDENREIELLFEFGTTSEDIDIIECGLQILA